MFDGRVALVTGGNTGIGRATAKAFARQGAKVLIAARREKEGGAVVEEIRKAGGEAMFLRTDISRAADCKAMVDAAVRNYGGLDIAFNNASILRHGKFIADDEERDWDEILAVNLKGTFLSMKYEIRHMLEHGGGTIINTSSVAGLVGTPGIGSYTATKFGVIGLTKTAALEYAGKNIRVNAVCPGATQTEMLEDWFANPGIKEMVKGITPVGRFADPEEIAGAVLFLASPAASFITGHALPVDGGLSVH